MLDAAVEAGVTFFDTADVYGDGRSEQLIGRFLADNPDLVITVATKMGRRGEQARRTTPWPTSAPGSTGRGATWASDQLDLVQLHCPPTSVYSHDQVYDALDTLVAEGVIAAYGVSVETCDEALTAISRRGTATVQIILNAFRRKPLDDVLPAAAAAGVGIIARVPLASGLLSGRYTAETEFAANDHRNYNRHGESFDVGETFSGVDYETGVAAAQEFAGWWRASRGDVTPAQAALAWVVQQPGVTTVIPGARSPEQARANAAAGSAAGAARGLPRRRGRPLRPPAAGEHPPALVGGAPISLNYQLQEHPMTNMLHPPVRRRLRRLPGDRRAGEPRPAALAGRGRADAGALPRPRRPAAVQRPPVDRPALRLGAVVAQAAARC